MTAEEKKIKAAIRLLERHGYEVKEPKEKVTIDQTEVNRHKLEERKKTFADTLRPFLDEYGAGMLNHFYLYWTEPNKTFTKMRFELQKTWDLKLRLANWARNNNKYGNGRYTTDSTQRSRTEQAQRQTVELLRRLDGQQTADGSTQGTGEGTLPF